jgi:hypothetical protein
LIPKADGLLPTLFVSFTSNHIMQELRRTADDGAWLGYGQGEPEMVEGMRVSAGYFRMLGVAPALGRDFKPEEDRPDTRFVVVLSHAFWQRRFSADPMIALRRG